jgi:hypothetical protein
LLDDIKGKNHGSVGHAPYKIMQHASMDSTNDSDGVREHGFINVDPNDRRSVWEAIFAQQPTGVETLYVQKRNAQGSLRWMSERMWSPVQTWSKQTSLLSRVLRKKKTSKILG